MKTAQWLAVPLAIVLFSLIACFPFVKYFDFDHRGPRTKNDDGTVSYTFGKWTHGHIPAWRIKAINGYEIDGKPIQMSSGGNANVSYLVVMLELSLAAILSAVIFGYRARGCPGRRKSMNQAWWGFATLVIAFADGLLIASDGFSWKRVVSFLVLSAVSIVFLHESVTSADESSVTTGEPNT